MKKTLSLFLVCIMLLTAGCALYGCKGNTPPESTSEPESSEPQDTGVKEPPECAEKTRMDALLSGVKADRSLSCRDAAANCSYTCSHESGNSSDGTYQDKNNRLLTDMTKVNSFNTFSWAGFMNVSELEIVVDLGKVVEKLADFEVGCLHQPDYGIDMPGCMSVYISENGKDFSFIGKHCAPDDMTVSGKFTFGIYLQEFVSARYVKFVLGDQKGYWLFVDEVTANAYGSGGDIKDDVVYDYYKECTVKKTIPEYWDEQEDDYDTFQNMAQYAKHISVSSFSPIPAADANTVNNVTDVSLLTDGKVPSEAIWDADTVFRMTRGTGRSIIVDLGKNCSVSSFGAAVINKQSWGVLPVVDIGVSVSADGEEWQGVATLSAEDSQMKSEGVYELTASSDKKYNARYVKFSFLLFSPHAAMCELTVSGTKNIQGASMPDENSADITKLSDSYKTPDEFDGIDNVLCCPIVRGDGKSDSKDAMVTAEEFLPYLAYYENGVMKDTFFDTMLFSPCSGYTVKTDANRMEGWKYYVEQEFLDGYNVKALNEAAGTVAKTLEKPDYKTNVFLSVLHPYVRDLGEINPFGDIDGDGTMDTFGIMENRKKAVKWIIDKQLKEYESIDHSNLDLKGFYWHAEDMLSTYENDIEVFRYASDYVHSLGYLMLWIPYYRAEGFAQWKEAGVDCACFQPNYSFMAAPDEDRLSTAAKIAKLYGMSVEIELSCWDNREDVKKYKEYLEYGVKCGYMDAVKVYYLDVIPNGLTQALEGDEYTSSIYRDTYLFSKVLLDENYSAAETGRADAPKNVNVTKKVNTVIRGRVNIADNAISAVVTVSPKYGTLKLNTNGRFTYTPFENFTGTDYFCVANIFTYGQSESGTVTVTVTP